MNEKIKFFQVELLNHMKNTHTHTKTKTKKQKEKKNKKGANRLINQSINENKN